MALGISRHYGMLRLFVCSVILGLPASGFGDCRVIEYPDHNEVICEETAQPQAGKSDRKESSKAETSKQKEFMFYSPVRTGAKIRVSADLSSWAIASPGDTLFSYRIDEFMNKIPITSTVTFVYAERSGDAMFAIREFGNGDLAEGTKTKNVIFDDKKDYLLLMPYKSGCSSDAADGIYLKMNRLEGSQLYYQLVIPPCLSKQLEQSMTE